ncbi:hypothetical protein PMIN03_012992 [Paraphaeosphaeria minitans]
MLLLKPKAPVPKLANLVLASYISVSNALIHPSAYIDPFNVISAESVNLDSQIKFQFRRSTFQNWISGCHSKQASGTTIKVLDVEIQISNLRIIFAGLLLHSSASGYSGDWCWLIN